MATIKDLKVKLANLPPELDDSEVWLEAYDYELTEWSGNLIVIRRETLPGSGDIDWDAKCVELTVK